MIRLNRIMIGIVRWGMIFSEDRLPPFRIMLYRIFRTMT